MENNRCPYTALYTKIKGKRGRGRPNRQWIGNIMEDLEPREINIAEDETQAYKEILHILHFLSRYCRNKLTKCRDDDDGDDDCDDIQQERTYI